MRCYCCDTEGNRYTIRKKYGVPLCSECREEIHSTLQEHDDDNLVMWSQQHVYTTTQEYLNKTLDNRPKVKSKVTLKQPDFDLYKGDEDE